MQPTGPDLPAGVPPRTETPPRRAGASLGSVAGWVGLPMYCRVTGRERYPVGLIVQRKLAAPYPQKSADLNVKVRFRPAGVRVMRNAEVQPASGLV